MQNCYQARVKSLLHSLFHISCPFFLELVIASAILNCPQLIQPANAKLPSQQQSILLSQLTAQDVGKRGGEFYLFKNGLFQEASAQDFENEGRVFFLNGRFQEAFESYDKATQLDPNNAYYLHRRGYSLAKLKRYQEAFESIDKATQLDPYKANYWYNRGYLLGKLKRYQEAFESIDKATQLEPSNNEYSNARVVALHLKRYQEGSEYFDKVRSLFALGKNQEVLVISNEVLTKNYPNTKGLYISKVWHLKGVAYLNLGEFQNALIQFDKAISLNDYYYGYRLPDNYSYSYRGLDFEHDLRSEVEVNFKRDLRSEDSWYGKGSALVGLKRYPEALNAFNEAIDLNPNFSSAIKARDQVRKLI